MVPFQTENVKNGYHISIDYKEEKNILIKERKGERKETPLKDHLIFQMYFFVCLGEAQEQTWGGGVGTFLALVY